MIDQIKAELVEGKRQHAAFLAEEHQKALMEEVATFEASLTPEVIRGELHSRLATVTGTISQVQAELQEITEMKNRQLDPLFEDKRSLEAALQQLDIAPEALTPSAEEAPVA